MARPTKNQVLMRSVINLVADALALRLTGLAGSAPAPRKPGRPAGVTARKRRFSPEARARISAAAKKRWAAYRKANPA